MEGKGGEENTVAIFPYFRLQSRFILVCWAIFFTASSCVNRDMAGWEERRRGEWMDEGRREGKKEEAVARGREGEGA